jgi:xanthine dehydrogenase YagR molybdenum-binding subunit
VRLDSKGIVTVETDMTDIGTGSYTIIAQTAAEMMGVPLTRWWSSSAIRIFRCPPVRAGSGAAIARPPACTRPASSCASWRRRSWGWIRPKPSLPMARCAPGRSFALAQAAADGELVAEDMMEYGDLDKKFQQSTFGAHFVEVAVDAYTGEPRMRRMLAVRGGPHPQSQIGAQPGDRRDDHGRGRGDWAGIDQRGGFFVNHDLAATRCRCMPTSRTRK